MHSEIGTIGRRVRETLQAAGVRLDIRVSATTIRKLYSSAAQELSPKKKQLINAHMRHKESTADSNYVIKVNAERSSRAHEIMKDIVSGKPDELDDDIWMPKEKEAEGESKQEAETAHQSCEQETADQACDQAPSSPLPQPAPEKEEAQLSNDDKAVLLCVFDHNIQRGEVLITSEVTAICRADPHLKELTVDQQKLKKACDFVRYKTNVVRQTMLTGEEADLYAFDVTDSSASGMQRTWNTYACCSSNL